MVADYPIATISAYMAKGQTAPDAVHAAFKLIGDVLEGGEYFY